MTRNQVPSISSAHNWWKIMKFKVFDWKNEFLWIHKNDKNIDHTLTQQGLWYCLVGLPAASASPRPSPIMNSLFFKDMVRSTLLCPRPRLLRRRTADPCVKCGETWPFLQIALHRSTLLMNARHLPSRIWRVYDIFFSVSFGAAEKCSAWATLLHKT